MATNLPSHKPSEPDTQDMLEKNSWETFSNELLHLDTSVLTK